MPCPLPAVLRLLLYFLAQRMQLVSLCFVCRGLAEAFVKGGQAFTIKLRPTEERSPTSMLLEPPRGINGTYHEIASDYLPWRQMK